LEDSDKTRGAAYRTNFQASDEEIPLPPRIAKATKRGRYWQMPDSLELRHLARIFERCEDKKRKEK
jgi:hypothetical protein